MNETNEAENKLPKVFFLESIHNIENQPQRKLKKSNTNTILKRKKSFYKFFIVFTDETLNR